MRPLKVFRPEMLSSVAFGLRPKSCPRAPGTSQATTLTRRMTGAAAALFFVPGCGGQVAPLPALDRPQFSGQRVAISKDEPALSGSRDAVVDQPRSLLNVPAPMAFGQFVWNEDRVPAGKVWIRVDLESQIISIFRAGHEIGTAVILYGTEEKPTPIGTFPILAKIEDHHSSLYGASMPYTLRMTRDGIAIHGSEVRRNRATHGCVGVPREFARQLYEEVQTGDLVVVVRDA